MKYNTFIDESVEINQFGALRRFKILLKLARKILFQKKYIIFVIVGNYRSIRGKLRYQFY